MILQKTQMSFQQLPIAGDTFTPYRQISQSFQNFGEFRSNGRLPTRDPNFFNTGGHEEPAEVSILSRLQQQSFRRKYGLFRHAVETTVITGIG
jgi:hypothetical protein